jgi:hypothetical protein
VLADRYGEPSFTVRGYDDERVLGAKDISSDRGTIGA